MKFVTVAVCTLCLVFVSARAVRVPFTYDEAASYIRYIDTTIPSVFDTNLLSIFNFEVATNHFLNTALTKVSYLVGGTSELVLRMPSLFGYALYLVFAGLILRRVSNPLIALGGLLLLNLNPYLLDFFALSRGYGLSLGLMMALLFFLLRFLHRLSAGRFEEIDLSRALALACAAIAANFALLNLYISVLVVVVIAAALFNRRKTSLPIEHGNSYVVPQRRAFPWLLLTAVVFVPLVLSQDSRLSASLYQPVAVRLTGLDESALDRVRVVRVDIYGREFTLRKEVNSQEWSSSGLFPFRGLRIDMPRSEAETIRDLEVALGARTFSFDPRSTNMWSMHESGETREFESAPSLSLRRSRVPTFRSVINWSGDRVYAARLALVSAVALGILSAFALSLRLLEPIALSTRLVCRQEWRALSTSAVWVAVLAGTPLHLLSRNAELYFGGTRGLMADTFTSVIENTFYGRHYSDAQVTVVFGCIGGMIAIFAALLIIIDRRRLLSTLGPAISLLTILLLVSLSLVAQRLLFGTVYLVGRTALFYIPLSVLFFTFVCDALTQSGRFGKALALLMVVTAVGLTSFHFARTANLKYVHDWQLDASTRSMIDDVRQFASGGPITVGVAPAFAPVALYYARRTAAPIEVVVVPTSRPVDFVYLEDRDVHSGDVVTRYPFTHTALERVSR